MKNRWIFLRGWARESSHWGDFRETFLSSFPDVELLTPDLPGTGIHLGKRSPETVSKIVESLRREIPLGEAKGILSQTFLLGHSLGAMVAMEWASRYPDELSGIVLLNPSAGKVSPVFHRLRPSALPQLIGVALSPTLGIKEKRVLKLISREGSKRPELIEDWVKIQKQRPMSAWNAIRQLRAAVSFRAPCRIEIPTLILCSLGDKLMNPRAAEALSQYLRLPLVTHPTAGHDLPMDEPQWLIGQIQTWMKSRMR